MTSHQRLLLFRLLAVLLLAIPLLWLAQQAARAGIAGIYGATAATYQEELAKSHAPEVRRQLLRSGVEKISRASALMPGHPGFSLQVADLVALQRGMDQRGDPALMPVDAIDVLHAALSDSPVRADLWWRLAREEYEVAGVNARTSRALAQALSYGPRESGPLLLNAMLIFNAGEQFETSQRLRGWSAVVEAATMPSMAHQVSAMASSAGKERQLQRLLQEELQRQARLKVPEDAR